MATAAADSGAGRRVDVALHEIAFVARDQMIVSVTPGGHGVPGLWSKNQSAFSLANAFSVISA